MQGRLKQHLQDPLYRNSLYIMLTSVSSAGFGFFFWMLAAKLYTKEDVGIGTALISSMGLLLLLSRFGLDFSIIRYFHTNDKSKILSTSLLITTTFIVILGVIFILGIDIWSPGLSTLKTWQAAALFLAVDSIPS